jgi:sugar phosphate isomerase/epimerase
MKLAISNIAWSKEEDARVADLMTKCGFAGLEVAPTMIWEAPLAVTETQARDYRRPWNDRGIEVVALQALLFGRPDLTLFEEAETRERTLEHLRGLMRLARWLGARVLVFGAPKNRRLGRTSASEAEEVALAFFGAAGADALAHEVVIAIEPNPPQYECDFVTTSGQGLDLVRRVGSAGFGLHLDAAAMTLAGESLSDSISACAGAIAHFHASEPFLGPVGEGGVDHESLASALRGTDYSHWVSIEMRPAAAALPKVLSYVARTYGG